MQFKSSNDEKKHDKYLIYETEDPLLKVKIHVYMKLL